MQKTIKFPIRFKILIALLLVITAVVSIITFTMANLFHTDKSAYVHDLTSEMAMHTAAETRALLVGYNERLQVFTRLLFEKELQPEQKSKLLKQLFEDFREFAAVSLYIDGKELTTVYDARSLAAADLTKEAFLKHYRQHPIPLQRVEKGDVYVANTSLSSKLPAFTLAISRPLPGEEGRHAVIVALIRLDGLQRLATRSKVFTTFVVDHQGNLLAHSDINKVVQHNPIPWVAANQGLQEMQVHGTTREFSDRGKPMVGGLSQVEVGNLLAGVEIPKAAAYLTARELLNNLIIVALLLLVVSAILGLVGSRLITRPLERLSEAARIVGKGNFDIQITPGSRDEIGDLSQSFNQMAFELDHREKALQQAQEALVQSEKMSAFGQLGAGIAHEIKNPLAGILGLTQLSMRKLEEEDPIRNNLKIIEKETHRCTTIIQNLMKFARQEKVEFAPVDLNQVAKDAMAIVEHQLEMNKVKIAKELQESLPSIHGNANQLQQVVINLMINAQQAMEGRAGQVKVVSASKNGHVKLKIIDNGPGIPEDIQTKIFEPFYTTKAVGKGTGLGLSVSYGIIKEHKGDIQLKSKEEKGTAFTLTFPAIMLTATCPHCNKTFKIQTTHIGLVNKCKKCGGVFEIKHKL